MFQIQITSIILLTQIDDIQPDADRARKSSETLPIYQVHKFCLVKKKKSLDLQIYSRIGKTMKKLYWILNTFVNTSALVIFWFL